MSDNNMSRVKNKQNNQKSKKSKQKKKKKKSWFKRIFLILIGLFFLALLAGGGLFAVYASNAPELTEEDLVGSYSSELLDADGNVFYTLGGENRDFAEAEEYPEIMTQAMTAIEDQNFYDHFGIDPIGIGRAAFGYISNLGEISGGGSTITQQLVKLSVFSTTREDQTLERKAQEAWLAIQLEQRLSKEQILTLYMNKIHMAKNVYGIATAAEEYYGKPVTELELHEAALFAGMAQAPNRYDPYVNPEAAETRRNIVLNVMRDTGKITAEEAEAAKSVPIQEGLVELSESAQNNMIFDSYLVRVLDEVREKTNLDPATAGLTIHTNLDLDAQQVVYDVVNSEDYVNFPDDELQTAISLVDVETGQVRAMVGGRKQEGQLLRNRATESTRQTGSTIKPLTTYGPAIELEQFSTYHQLIDEEWSYPDGTPLRNYDGKYVGQLSMREALVDSRNIPTAQLFSEELNPDEVTAFLDDLGIDASTFSPEGVIVPSNSISAPVSPLQMAASYAAFANGGNYTEPYTVSKVITQDEQEINLVPETNQAISDYTAYMVTDMLKGVPEVYSSTVGIPGLPQAGKTGTTNYSSEQHEEFNIPSNGVPDSWYVGYTTNYSMSVWTGYDQQTEEGHWLTNEDGTRQLPRNIYQAIMSRVSEGLENNDWTKPASVSEVRVEEGSMPAKLPGPNTPESSIVTELFVSGSEPSQVSTSYGEQLSAPAGLSANYDAETNTIGINWNEYELVNSDASVSYLLNVNGTEYTINQTEFTIPEPNPGSLPITLAVQAYGNTGPAATTSVNVPETDPEPENEEMPEETDQGSTDENTNENSDPNSENPPEETQDAESGSEDNSDSNGENESENPDSDTNEQSDNAEENTEPSGQEDNEQNSEDEQNSDDQT